MIKYAQYIGLLFLLLSSLLFAQTNLEQDSMLTVVISSFVAGLLLTFTPCVLPMVPILSSIVVGQGKKITKMKALTLSLSYVLGTAITYALMGALAGATGEQLQSYFQNVWAIGAMSLVFIIMAFSMFGLYTIQLPSFIQSELNKSSEKIKGGNHSMVFLLGMVSALIIGACVSPILIAFLGVALSKGDAWIGAITMFSMALGMGIPLILLGLGMGQLLPKAGQWMENIKYIFGILLIATAIYLFNTLSLLPSLLLWGLYVLIISLFLIFKRWFFTISLLEKAIKIIGVLLLVWSIMLIIGGVYKETDPFNPLPDFSKPYSESHKTLPFKDIKSLEELSQIQIFARTKEKPILLYFYSDTCSYCRKMKETTFQNTSIRKLLKEEYIALKVNLTDKSNHATQSIKKRYHVFGVPTFIFFDKRGVELTEQSVYGYLDAESFYDLIELMLE